MALHIDIPTPAQLATLLDTRAPDCVSIYLPTSPLPQDADAARIEFKNLVAEAGTSNELLTDLAEDPIAWLLLAHSLAVFATPGSLRSFRLPNRLTSLAVVADRFHIKPLLRAVTFPQAALVLALSQHDVRLIEVAGDVPPSEVELPELFPLDTVHLHRYARQIDRALRPTLAGLGLPLILAATEPLDSFYRSTNTYPALLDEGVPGNPEHMTPAELAAASRPILDALYAAQLDAVRERFKAWQSRGRAATDLSDVARAATFGAVDTLLVDIDDLVEGSIDDSGTISDGDGQGVVDEIARRVIATGGKVLAVRRDDIPHGNTAAALLRHPV
ncbi:hypothetical protein OJ997_22820 [Solirubrobacter phytolaccae]|uniref:Uncharacterized protein n=1 Tax=Solirubrobacter phytolaccae TaxID=1404360 RepID=A0A9X3NFG7_9ACTN|nr:hypothetical protein [Solirubrobacter phytolaccae]MDA0183161.1 hypothetical protein [Solirubrobacter phytolaccae]